MLKEKVVNAVKTVLKQGLGPEQIALTVCLGSAAGTIPVVGGTTLLCVLLAARFGLNQAAMQAVNYLAYPLQIALFVPFFQLGERFVPWGPAVSLSMLKALLHGQFTVGFALIGWITLKAVAAWLVTVPPLAGILYPVLVKILRRNRPECPQ
ncbi:DUF2062 domain-containing protein [Geomonas sp. Red32]|uniref:DUF2062 domain-containing protein n=1 Tax=Geomonas sp. Red32 TaxID=2912856 RepID=UPI00202CD4D4|nr:DUF2062 domain-containing protein [Geomonas sp. Red32]